MSHDYDYLRLKYEKKTKIATFLNDIAKNNQDFHLFLKKASFRNTLIVPM